MNKYYILTKKVVVSALFAPELGLKFEDIVIETWMHYLPEINLFSIHLLEFGA